MPIGCLTCQYYANHYLALANHCIKEEFHALAYVRYMDDMVIWTNDMDLLQRTGNKFRSFTESKSCLTLKPFCLNSIDKGLSFLGYVLFLETVLLINISRKRFKTILKQYTCKLNTKEWNQAEYQTNALPLLAYARHADTFNLRTKYIKMMKAG